MSISNHSIDLAQKTDKLEALLTSYAAQLDVCEDDDMIEWLESGIEIIEDALAKREDDEPMYDSPSLQDDLGELPSYAS